MKNEKLVKNNIKMIDISDKKLTQREAIASVNVIVPAGVIKKIKIGALPKGDCLGAARVAGILAAKNAAVIIPLCHQINLSFISIDFKFKKGLIEITSIVRANYATGVEMEALLACSVAALIIYDMAKSEEKGIIITDLRLLKKTGGKTGDYSRDGR